MSLILEVESVKCYCGIKSCPDYKLHEIKVYYHTIQSHTFSSDTYVTDALYWILTAGARVSGFSFNKKYDLSELMNDWEEE